MAYASKYYDPEKAHEYYMKNRELKGYENRYGGARGNGTSAASGGIVDLGGSSSGSSGGKTVIATRSGSNSTSASSSSSNTTKEHNQKIQNKISSKRAITNRQINELREELKSMSKEDRKANRKSIQEQIKALRQQSNDEIQGLKEQRKGGSTSGFNQKGMEAAMYIKDQMEKERDEVINKANKDADNEMLDSVKRLAADIKAMRESGRGFNRQQFKSRIKAMLGETKKKKIKSKRKYINDYKQKYKDEIDKLRSDRSMYSYWDNNSGIQVVSDSKTRTVTNPGIQVVSNSNTSSGAITIGNNSSNSSTLIAKAKR